MKDEQFFQEGYNIYRNDRNLNGGGVRIAVKDTYITSSVPELQTDCEIAWCKMEIVGAQLSISPLTTTQRPQMKEDMMNLE